MWNDRENTEENCEMIWTIWKKSKLKRYGQYVRKVGWIVKRYEKYWRKVGWIVKRYGNYERKVSWIVKRFGKYGRKVSDVNFKGCGLKKYRKKVRENEMLYNVMYLKNK